MTHVKVYDKGGNSITYLELDGRLLPDFNPEALRGVPNLELRPDDVILACYPKSGTHWVWEVAMMLLRGKGETIPYKKSLAMMEFMTQEQLGELDSPRVLNTHYPLHLLPAPVREGKHKVIRVNRNPKDVAVSYYNHHTKLKHYYGYEGEWANYLPMFLEGKMDFGSWFDYTLDWERVHATSGLPILHLTYEDMKEDPVRETERLAQFLGVQDKALCQAVATKCDFQNMLVDKKPYHQQKQEDGHLSIYRKGIVGDWKNWFTVAQSEFFDSVYKEKMKTSSLKFRYQL